MELMAADNALEDGLPAINKQRQKQILLYFRILYYVSFEANFILSLLLFVVSPYSSMSSEL